MKLPYLVSAALLATAPMVAIAEETKNADTVADVVTVAKEASVTETPETPIADDVIDSVAEDTDVSSAAAFPNGLQFGVGVSATSGLNGFVGYANKDLDNWWLRRLGLRLDFAGTKPLKSVINSGIDSIIGDEGVEIEDITINNVNLEAQHFGAIVDFYPFGDTWFLGGWRLSGGYMWGSANVGAGLTGDVAGVPDDSFAFSFDGVDYKYTGGDIHGTAEIDWDYSGPYLGTGFDIGLFAGFKIYLDAGVVFVNNAPDLLLNVPTDNLQQSTDGGNTWNAVDVDLLDAKKAEVLDDARQELERVDFYPMVKLGFMYRF